jgi:hypothetical protein
MVRMWVDNGGFRARITSMVDVGKSGEYVRACEDPDEVTQALEQFITDFIKNADAAE